MAFSAVNFSHAFIGMIPNLRCRLGLSDLESDLVAVAGVVVSKNFEIILKDIDDLLGIFVSPVLDRANADGKWSLSRREREGGVVL